MRAMLLTVGLLFSACGADDLTGGEQAAEPPGLGQAGQGGIGGAGGAGGVGGVGGMAGGAGAAGAAGAAGMPMILGGCATGNQGTPLPWFLGLAACLVHARRRR
jgi:hypothetical protein